MLEIRRPNQGATPSNKVVNAEIARRPVSRVLSRPRAAGDDHSSGTSVTGRLARPTRATARKPARRRPFGRLACRPYAVLLPVGFTMPLPLPVARCALTAPFHPCRPEGRRFAFCGTFPGVAPAGRYPAPCFRGARTFLPPCRSATGVKGSHPAVWRLLGRPPGHRRQSIHDRRGPAAVSP